MAPDDLWKLKRDRKKLAQIPVFRAIKTSLPRPFHRYKSKRLQSSGMLDMENDYTAIFFWRDGPLLTDRAFYGHLFQRRPDDRLSPVFEFHWHPSHKNAHCKVPCNTDADYTNRMLAGAPELAMNARPSLDPGNETDRHQLVEVFCIACGIELPTHDQDSLPLFTLQ